MIASSDGTKTTPKKLAEEILFHAIASKMEFLSEDGAFHGLTEREIKLVEIQCVKIADRLIDKLGYEKQYENMMNGSNQ